MLVSDACIVALAKCFLHPIAIDIGRCINITDDGLAIFASVSSNVRLANHLDRSGICGLRRISLQGCSNITDIGISAIACNCLQLNNIYICGCKKITDVGVSATAHNCSALTTIILFRVSAIGPNCPFLNSIDISYRNQIADEGVSPIAHNSLLLKSITLSGCKKITDICVIAVGHNCPLLIYVDVHGCFLICADLLLTLRDDNPQLNILHS